MIKIIKTNTLNPFDKAFFGKTMIARARDLKNTGELLVPSNLKLDCIYDLNHFFVKQSIAKTLEKSPVSDSFVKTELGTDIPSFVKNAIK